jgi:hypothetical protein
VLELEKIHLDKSWHEQPRLCLVWVHRTVRWCTRQCPVRQSGSGEKTALGNSSVVYNYNSPDCPVVHRTVRWCTGLSGEPTVSWTNGRSRNPRVTRGRANGLKGHRTVRCAPDSVRCANGSKTPTVGCAKTRKKSAPDSVRWCTGLSGAPCDRRQELPSWNALNGS